MLRCLQILRQRQAGRVHGGDHVGAVSGPCAADIDRLARHEAVDEEGTDASRMRGGRPDDGVRVGVNEGNLVVAGQREVGVRPLESQRGFD